MKKYLPLLSIVLVLALAGLAEACPNCKSAQPVYPTADEAQAGSLPGGFNSSIYFMLGSLFVVISAIGTMIVKAVRDANKAKN